MSDRYFVTVTAPDKRALANLQLYELDFFHSSAQALSTVALRAAVAPATAQEDELRIDGLIPLADIGRLVEDGYQVMVKESGDKPTPAQTETITFEQWLAEMEE